MRRANWSTGNQYRLLRVSAGYYKLMAHLRRMGSRKEQSSNGLQLAPKTQLPVKFRTCHVRRAGDLAGRQQDTESDRQIESPALFGKIGGREIDSNVARREFEVGVGQSSADTLLAFLYDSRRQADDTEGGQSGSETDFDMHEWSVQPDLSAASDRGECHDLPWYPFP